MLAGVDRRREELSSPPWFFALLLRRFLILVASTYLHPPPPPRILQTGVVLPPPHLLYSISLGANEDRVEGTGGTPPSLQRLQSPGVAAAPSSSVRSTLRLYIPTRSARRADDGRSARERRRWRRLREGGMWRGRGRAGHEARSPRFIPSGKHLVR